jgi:biopolymer transport protein ExbD
MQLNLVSNKIFVSITLVVLVIILAFFTSIRQRVHLPEQGAISEDHSSVQGKPESPFKSLSVQLQQVNQSHEAEGQSELARSDSVIAKWRSERGYAVLLGSSRAEDYRSYDIETLKRLADGSDGFAVDELAKRAIVNGREAVESVLKNAAIKGSVESLYLAGNYAHVFSQRLESVDARRAGTLDALTWFSVAALRGDRSFNLERSSGILSELADPLSDQDRESIRSRAQEIYNDLQQQRTAMGLGDFDNSVPPEVKAYYDDIEANVNGLYKR